MTTILSYLKGDFAILPMHNSDFARLKYDELPEQIQREFLSFPLSVNILEGTEDPDVLEIFFRLNSYSVPLNEQEKLNARYVGAFKNSMLELSKEHLAFWKRHRILSAQPIARMKDVELTCELIAVMMNGLQNQKKIIGVLYKQYDDDLPQFAELRRKLGDTLQLCEDLLNGNIAGTVFRRTSLFYSFFAAVYDQAYGIPPAAHSRRGLVDSEGLTQAKEQLVSLSEALGADQEREEWSDFYEATRQSTDKLPQRQVRHRLLESIVARAFGN